MFYFGGPQWDRHKHTHTHSPPHTHFVWPSGPFQWNGPYLFLIVLATTWCGVVASQSVAARGFPRVCVFLLSTLLLLVFVLFLLLSIFNFAHPPLFLYRFPSFSSNLGFWLRYSTVCQPIAAPHTRSHQKWFAAAHHSACQLLSMGGPGVCIT